MKIKNLSATIVLALCFWLSSVKSNGQTTWIPLDTIYGNNLSTVIISYYEDNCQGSPSVFLKIENVAMQSQTITWSLWPNIPTKATLMSANETKEGECISTAEWWLVDPIPSGLTIANLSPIITIQ